MAGVTPVLLAFSSEILDQVNAGIERTQQTISELLAVSKEFDEYKASLKPHELLSDEFQHRFRQYRETIATAMTSISQGQKDSVYLNEASRLLSIRHFENQIFEAMEIWTGTGDESSFVQTIKMLVRDRPQPKESLDAILQTFPWMKRFIRERMPEMVDNGEVSAADAEDIYWAKVAKEEGWYGGEEKKGQNAVIDASVVEEANGKADDNFEHNDDDSNDVTGIKEGGADDARFWWGQEL